MSPSEELTINRRRIFARVITFIIQIIPSSSDDLPKGTMRLQAAQRLTQPVATWGRFDFCTRSRQGAELAEDYGEGCEGVGGGLGGFDYEG